MSGSGEQAGQGLPLTLLATIGEMMNRQGRDLTARQLGLLLICYMTEEPQTVRGLATQLGVSRPVVSRALDRLAGLSLAVRVADHRDRRSVLVRRTPEGWAFLREISEIASRAAVRSGHVTPAGEPKRPRAG